MTKENADAFSAPAKSMATTRLPDFANPSDRTTWSEAETAEEAKEAMMTPVHNVALMLMVLLQGEDYGLPPQG